MGHRGIALPATTNCTAILLAPTLVGTIYGMNFEHMPAPCC
jgi:Mg2+ and Co2+ transporter CorA